MNYLSFKWTKTSGKSFFGTVFVLIFAFAVFAQKTAETKDVSSAAKNVKVTQLDAAGLKNLLKPNSKPLLVNFWATWCEPCREEFPDLVKIDQDFRGKIDFFTVSLDDSAEITTGVPRFLESMKAEMPAYLLKVPDEGEVISAVAKDWQGGLPFTILYNERGEITYFKQGKIKIETLKAEIEKLISKPIISEIINLELPRPKIRSVEEGITDAKNDISKNILKIKKYGFGPGSAEQTQYFKKNYSIEIEENGCMLFNLTEDYFKAYNEIMKAEIQKRLGIKVAQSLPL